MTLSTALIIAAVLFLIAWQQRRHEQQMAQLLERVSVPPPAYFVPTPAPAPERGPLMYAELFPEAEPFELREAPTRVMPSPIHPRFESYGVEVSFAPTIAVD